jgi:hypothetical protein
MNKQEVLANVGREVHHFPSEYGFRSARAIIRGYGYADVTSSFRRDSERAIVQRPGDRGVLVDLYTHVSFSKKEWAWVPAVVRLKDLYLRTKDEYDEQERERARRQQQQEMERRDMLAIQEQAAVKLAVHLGGRASRKDYEVGVYIPAARVEEMIAFFEANDWMPIAPQPVPS